MRFLLHVCLLSIVWWPVDAAFAAAVPKVPAVGLVLGGGGARGLAHIGILAELERMRIPIACIAGTSAGALVGGIYASGMDIGRLEKEVVEADWIRLLTGAPVRSELPYFRKRDDFKNLADVTLGLSRDGVLMPRAAVSSQAIDVFLRRLTRDIALDSFDKLPIPFQAVATDLEQGSPVEFTGGDLAIALRASMAVPGAFDLVELDGRLLVDGMLVRNVPVQNVKGRCADTVIVVDVGAPFLKAEQIRSLLDVTTQQSNILVGHNVRAQLALLGPDDLLIKPDLKRYTSADFIEAREIIALGHAAVEPFRQRLEFFSVSPEQYAAWKESVAQRKAEEFLPYDEVKIAKTRFVPSTLLDALAPAEGVRMDQAELIKRTGGLYDMGDFDRVGYVLREEGGRRVADVMPLERAVGPNYLRFGLDFKLDTYRHANVAFLGNVQFNWLNRWGLQWRNDLRLGKDSTLLSELLQPLDNSGFFAAAGLRRSRDELDVFTGRGTKLAVLGFDSGQWWADLGYSLGNYGELRVGYRLGDYASSMLVGPVLSPVEGRVRGYSGSLVIDQLDNPRFPRRGYYLKLESYFARSSVASVQEDPNFIVLNSTFDAAHTFGRYTLRGSLEINGAVSNSAAETGSLYALGGFLRLSGFQDREFIGSRAALARLMAYRQVASVLPALGSGMYLGTSFESGRVWRDLFGLSGDRLIYAGSAFLGFDTVMGPLYIAYGQGEAGRRAGYLYLGVEY